MFYSAEYIAGSFTSTKSTMVINTNPNADGAGELRTVADGAGKGVVGGVGKEDLTIDREEADLDLDSLFKTYLERGRYMSVN